MAAKRCKAAVAKFGFPTKARIVYRGKIQSEQFEAGAFAFAALLKRMHGREAVGGADWSKRGEFIEEWIRGELVKDGDYRNGVLAAVAGFFNEYTQNVEIEVDAWEPLRFVPYVDDEGRDEPQDESLFLDVASVPVSVAPDLTTHKWNENDAAYFSIDVARTVGKPISRRKFNAMRRATETAAPGGGESSRPRPARRAPGKPAGQAMANHAGVNLPEITMRLAGAYGLLVMAALAMAHKVGDSSKLARALSDVEQARDTLEDINRAIEMIGIPCGDDRCGDLIIGKAMVLQAIRHDALYRRAKPAQPRDSPDVDDGDDEED